MANDNDLPELTRPVLVRLEDDGSHSAVSVTTPKDFKIRAACLIPSRLVVPIVFVPGIMGTRLKVKRTAQTAAWYPPEGTADGLMQVLGNLGRNAARRQRLLNPDTTEIDDSGVAHPDLATAVLLGDAPGDTDIERSRWRGWGQLHAQSYGGILALLEQRLAHMMKEGCQAHPAWKAAVMDWQDADKLGAQKPFEPLDDDALRKAASVFYPVHAVGYNWLQSNRQSGERLAGEIRRILAYYRERKKIAERVILVTHSMGGLVARACLQMEGMQDMVLGVVHGVMPAIGAPAVYKRMRAGFEHVEQVILGRDAAEATAVVCHSPGTLELLPTPQYRHKDKLMGPRHWLSATQMPMFPGQEDPILRAELGDANDPYNSIYLNNDTQHWWRMVKEELIDPAGREEREKARREGKKVVQENDHFADFESYQKVMNIVKELHDAIADKYHPKTYAYYGADIKAKCWNQVNWRCAYHVGCDLKSAPLQDDDLNGRVTVKLMNGPVVLVIDAGEGAGDGTVPAESGSAPTPHVAQMFRHEGAAKGHTEYDHQNSYGADLTQAVTLYSVARMMADSDWLRDNLSKA